MPNNMNWQVYAHKQATSCGRRHYASIHKSYKFIRQNFGAIFLATASVTPEADRSAPGVTAKLKGEVGRLRKDLQLELAM